MLTLTRKMGESIRIGDHIQVVIKEVKGRQVRIGISAPRDVYVCREELYLKIQQANREAHESMNATLNHSNQSLASLGSLILAKHPNSSPESSPKLENSSHNEITIDIQPQIVQKEDSKLTHTPVYQNQLTGDHDPSVKEDQDES